VIVSTTPAIEGRQIQKTLGLVRGSAIRTRHLFTDILEFLRNLVGAELKDYVKMMGETREQALDHMIAEAREKGADAVVGVRLATSQIVSGAAEVIAYGTAVKLAPEQAS
jgi:uncharacterized protein YbjQ (UPF0145 family)